MIIGVLALQGSVIEHSMVIESQGDIVRLVKVPRDLEGICGLIIPGGESTTLSKILKIQGLDKAIITKYNQGLFIWGTCAGLVLLGSYFNLIDIEVLRNGYGSHSKSFTTEVKFQDKHSKVKFIRAPKIVNAGADVNILVEYMGEIVAAENNKILVTSFHPEVSGDLEFYKYFKLKISN